MNALCQKLADLSTELEKPNAWPAKQLEICGQAGVFRWFMPREFGGFGWNEADQTRGYLRLASACLTTTFIITQRMGAARRVAGSNNEIAREEWLPGLLSGQTFCTVGISHLTTSRRHLSTAVLRAREVNSETGMCHFVLDGFCPWVTGGAHADGIVIAATLDDGREILAIVPTDSPGVTAHPGTDLVALSASCTDRVDLANVDVTSKMLLAGPAEHVMTTGIGGGTGGVQTSTLAVGLSSAATTYLSTESQKRPELVPVAEELSREVAAMEDEVVRAASDTGSCDLSDLRGRANRLALRTTQAAITAAKGAGYVTGHPAGRWCREALFFLVWSCPQPVSQAHLCELAGLSFD